jgi:cytochrome oxidase Cu insertion factor (SCO1/SenC/PrrC family)
MTVDGGGMSIEQQDIQSMACMQRWPASAKGEKHMYRLKRSKPQTRRAALKEHSSGPDGMQKLVRAAFIATLVLMIITATAWGIRALIAHRNQTTAQSTTTTANGASSGFLMAGNLAPDFTLIDQFGHSLTFSSLRGHEVVLAFIDSRCKDVCPLTATIMYDAKARLKASAASQVELVAINANPTATSVTEVQAWSIAHGMLHQWKFLTGTTQQLESVYHRFHVYIQVDSSGRDIHDPITFIIDAQGHERLSFETLPSGSQSDLGDEVSGLEAGMQQWLPQSP